MIRVRSILVLAPLLLAAAASVRGAELTYELGPGDKVRITVNEWRASRGEVYAWDALRGEYTVNVAGAISMPLIGEIPAAGLSTERLAAAISIRLQSKIGLAQRAETSVEIIEFRPFYILGSVNKAGEYPFRPGLTVLQAIGIAGGFIRSAELRVQREAIAAVGNLRVLEVERRALLVRKARLEAELKGAETIVYPEEIQQDEGSASTAQFVRQEQLIFASRLDAVRSQSEALEQVKILLQNEIKALRDKEQVQDRQLGLARRELELVGSLVARGLSVNARQLDLERLTAQMESSRLDLNTAILRAQQDISKATRDGLVLRNQRQNEAATELKEAQVRLESLSQRLETTRQLIAEAEAEGLLSQADAVVPIFSLVRRSSDGSRELVVPETAPVQPGDVVKIVVPVTPRQQRINSLEDRPTASVSRP